MIAIYARQSVDRVNSISIESQIEFCQYEARGETFKTYIDRGYSGKNIDGGRVPYGFRLILTVIGNIKTSMYEIGEEEAEQIRLIYELYAQPECSYGDITIQTAKKPQRPCIPLQTIRTKDVSNGIEHRGVTEIISNTPMFNHNRI